VAPQYIMCMAIVCGNGQLDLRYSMLCLLADTTQSELGIHPPTANSHNHHPSLRTNAADIIHTNAHKHIKAQRKNLQNY